MIRPKMGQFEVFKRPYGSEFNAPRNGVSNIHVGSTCGQWWGWSERSEASEPSKKVHQC